MCNLLTVFDILTHSWAHSEFLFSEAFSIISYGFKIKRRTTPSEVRTTQSRGCYALFIPSLLNSIARLVLTSMTFLLHDNVRMWCDPARYQLLEKQAKYWVNLFKKKINNNNHRIQITITFRWNEKTKTSKLAISFVSRLNRQIETNRSVLYITVQ